MKINENEVPLLVKMLIHDLEKPMAVNTRILERLCSGQFDLQNPSHHQVIKGTYYAMERLNRMLIDLNDILLSRDICVKTRECSIKDLMEELAINFTPMAESEGIEFHLHCDFTDTLTTDPDLLYRIIENYLYNALNHTAPSEWIHLEAVTGPANDMVISVSNSGPVIDRHALQTIFEPGVQLSLRQQNHWRGSGLGLAFCKLAAQALNMRVYAEILAGNNGMVFYCQTLHREKGEKES